ncbi:tyrosine-type recombinase/integrase [Kamptonema sp. PCC 6506]|uniref:tyrosine-type recombinase/integrase n=1 Tax=Kamptonema sp. PCC 6506 TaxID=272129 RepID=UPI0001DAD6F4|nr:tyrosine-type recombinase/integrase [Kamptonema sp. PCC 6506]CBN53629.1 Tyrosine recombinase XerC [Kamptonema sp. PCC 6506]
MTVTLARLAREFLDRPGLSLSTQRSYESTLMPLLGQWGRLPIEIISRQLVLDYLRSLTHLSITTHHRHQAIIQALLNFGVEQGYLTVNPIAGLKQRKLDPEKGECSTDAVIRYLSAEQLSILYELLVPDVRLHAIVRLLHRTGARIGELLTLDLEGIDLQLQKFQVMGKGKKLRWCFYSEDAASIVNNYIKYYRDLGTPALFTAQNPFNQRVTRLSYQQVYCCWQSFTEKSPLLQGIRLHDLRHTFATERVGLMALEELRALMGHENIQTTLRYQKVTSLRAEEVARDALNILVAGQKKVNNTG